MARGHNLPRFYEGASDPKMRPSVDLLISKMRRLSNLQNHPDAVLTVIDDMLYHYYVREAVRPAHLWQAAIKAMNKLMMVTGQSMPDRQILEAAGVSIMPTATEPTPTDPVSSSAIAPTDVLNNIEIKKEVNALIAQHMYRYSGNVCTCGKEFPSHREWANHLRIRVWRHLLEASSGGTGQDG